MSDRLTAHLLQAGKDLGITVVAPFTLRLGNGREFRAAALLPEFGAPSGTIVCHSPANYLESLDELKERGYTVSSYREPPVGEEYDPETYMEMFSDWGWTSIERQQPPWLR